MSRIDNQNYTYIGKEINNFLITDVYCIPSKRSYTKYLINIYYAKVICTNCGNERTITMKHLKKVIKNQTKEPFYCKGCDNFYESSSALRVKNISSKKEK